MGGSPFPTDDLSSSAAALTWGLGLQTLPPREAFLAYAGRLTEREGYKSAVAQDQALLSKQTA